MKITIDTLNNAINIAKNQNMVILRIDMTSITHRRLCLETHQDIIGFVDIPIRITDHNGLLIAKQEDYQKMQEENMTWRL